jgi:uncharacterized protein YoaH (UPF0181 family)
MASGIFDGDAQLIAKAMKKKKKKKKKKKI